MSLSVTLTVLSLAALLQPPDAKDQLSARLKPFWDAFHAKQFSVAASRADKVLDEAGPGLNTADRGHALALSGIAHRLAKRPRVAIQRLTRAASLLERGTPSAMAGTAAFQLGLALRELGRTPNALRAFRRAKRQYLRAKAREISITTSIGFRSPQ